MVLVIAAPAQRNTGSIAGVVTDPTGAVIPNAIITVTNIQTGAVRTQTVQATGNYDIVSLPPGQYTVSVSSQGFTTEVRKGINLNLDQDARLDFSLKVSSGGTQTVTVTADTPALNTESAELGTTLGGKQVADLPSYKRDILDGLLLLSPGVTYAREGYENDKPMSFSVNGGRALTQDLVVDGAEALSVNINSWELNNAMFAPNQDAVQEMKLQTNAYSAENGRGTAAINIITKSGTNEFHGDAYYYLRNEALNANEWFNKSRQIASGKPNKRAVSRDNLYGGTIGGPVLKNKLFFFMLYEREPSSTPNYTYSTVPNQAFRSGDFSSLLTLKAKNSSGNIVPAPIVIYDPTTYNPVTGMRTPYANNKISGQSDPVALKALSYLPAPTFSNLTDSLGNPTDINNEYFVGNTTLTPWRINPRIDYTISPKQLLFFKLGHSVQPAVATGNWPNASPADNSRQTTNEPYWNGVLGHTYSVNDHLINDFRGSLERDSQTTVYPANGQDYATKLGINYANPGNFPIFGFGSSIGNYSMGPSNALNQWEQTLQYADTITYIARNHTLRFGGDLRLNQVNKQAARNNPSGQFGFSGNFTNQGPSAAGQSVSMADFLLGYVTAYSIQPADLVWGARKKEASWFAQDDWKITPSLTLNLGVREDLQFSWHEVLNRYAEFSPTLSNGGTYVNSAGTVLPSPQGGIQFGINQVSGNHFVISPRVGFAWTPFTSRKAVIRGGAGRFISPPSTIEDYGDAGFGQEAGYTKSASVSTSSHITPAFCLAQSAEASGCVGSGTPPIAVLPAHTPDIVNNGANGGAIWYVDKTATPVVYTWSLTVQQQLPANVVVQASYVGTRGLHLPWERGMNQLTSAGRAAEQASPTPTTPNDFTPYPQYAKDGMTASYHDADSTYHSLQLSLQDKFSQNLNWTLSYTLSKAMDNSSMNPILTWGSSAGFGGNGIQDIYNLRANWGRSAFDQRQALSASFLYQLPIGHGQKFLNKGVVGRAVGGWQVNAIVAASTGTPVDFTMTHNWLYGNNAEQRPNCVAGQKFRGSPSQSGTRIVGWWNPNAFTDPGKYNLGDCPRDLGAGPGFQQVDLSAFKNFSFRTPVNENTILQFRMEAYNAMNRVNFNTPGFNVPNDSTTNPNFGAITSSVGGPRNMTAALKLIF